MRLRCLLPAFLLALTCLSSAQITLNQIDDFQQGHNHNWEGGANPTNIASGGPAGTGDRYVQISSNGSNLATFNVFQWSGSYLGEEVDRVEAHLKNNGANPLVIRLVLFSQTGDRWSSTVSYTLAPGSGWTRVHFPITQTNFQRTMGSGTWQDLIVDVERTMFRHEPNISPGGTSVTGALGIDNVTAYRAMAVTSVENYMINIGIWVSGQMADLNDSNDSYLSIRQDPARSRLDPAVSVTFESTADPGAFAMIHFELEASTSANPAPAVTQVIEFYNFQTDAWVVVDSRPASATDQFAEGVTMATAPFIQSGSRRMRARVRYMDPGTLLTRSWGVNFDMVRWVLMR